MNTAKEGSLRILLLTCASQQIAHQRGIVRYRTDKEPPFLTLQFLSCQATGNIVVQANILALCMGMIARPPLLPTTPIFHTRRALTSQ